MVVYLLKYLIICLNFFINGISFRIDGVEFVMHNRKWIPSTGSLNVQLDSPQKATEFMGMLHVFTNGNLRSKFQMGIKANWKNSLNLEC